MRDVYKQAILFRFVEYVDMAAAAAGHAKKVPKLAPLWVGAGPFVPYGMLLPLVEQIDIPSHIYATCTNIPFAITADKVLDGNVSLGPRR